MKITYLGHATLSIKIDDRTIIVDPFITDNEFAHGIDISSLKADYILLTHAHGDHILDVEVIAKNTGADIISNYEIVNHFEAKGIKGHPMNHGGAWQFDFGKLHMVNAVHTSSFPDGSYGGNPAGFVLETSDHKVYIAGDTALTYDMKLIPMVIGKLDLAILPIGDNFTMGIESAVVASDFVECDRIMGYHFDTFGYIKIDRNRAVKKFADKEKELILLEIKGSLTL